MSIAQTRPVILPWSQERRRFSRQARAQGLRLRKGFRGILRYVSPPFELNALRAAGWRDVPSDWRRGDLAILSTTGESQLRLGCAPDGARWTERSLGWIRIRVRIDETPVVDPTLRRLIGGDVLSEVSRRHPLRQDVRVWTSGNRIFGCASPGVFVVILDALGRGSDLYTDVEHEIGRRLTSTERWAVTQAARQVGRIARTEERELAALGWVVGSPEAEWIAS